MYCFKIVASGKKICCQSCFVVIFKPEMTLCDLIWLKKQGLLTDQILVSSYSKYKPASQCKHCSET